MVAFTDEDLAKRFVADTKHQRNNFLGVFPVETSDLLKEIVLMVHRARGHRVNLLLDISEKGAGPMVRYDEIVE
ncbi:MAG: hypothetical protein KDA88_19085 [Planctomycetaceae bacterium]|nr:hypothetical protein [Planctomycetaceae bacterium]MCB9952836.1 hypothetical protein [Planctomycetaceae bacterium]